MTPAPAPTYDLAIIGGGINGTGIARDAAGRGLSVVLCEKGDFAGATSSASSKLIHGGLRYLEQYEFRLVAEALAEREVLLRNAPHVIYPLTFVLPWVPQMRPRWMLRIGLWLYDRIGGRTVLPASRTIDARKSIHGSMLESTFTTAFTYPDCWVDDARLVIQNAMAARALGAAIHARTRVVGARRDGGAWRISARHGDLPVELRARVLVNAAGPWTRAILPQLTDTPIEHDIRLVKGSHIVVRKLYDGDHAYILQNDDQRVVLVIPYLDDYTLIGTTDVPHHRDAEEAGISADEITYLCAAVNRYSVRKLSSADVYWSYSGVRPLYDDGASNPSEVTRDYKFKVDDRDGVPLLSIYGGKITTYRKLAEHALEDLKPWLPGLAPGWTHASPLPGGDLGGQDFAAFLAALAAEYPFLPPRELRAFARRHGTLARTVLAGARRIEDLGEAFGAGLYRREVDYLIAQEWAHSAEDILWRRTKSGLLMSDAEQNRLRRYVDQRVAGATQAAPTAVR
jgi:glycerol-3-phosphate dehydrogenase